MDLLPLLLQTCSACRNEDCPIEGTRISMKTKSSISSIKVNLTTLLQEGNALLIKRTLDEECLSWVQDVVVVTRCVSLIDAVISVPDSDRSSSLHTTDVIECGIWVTNEVPAAVLAELAEILVELYRYVVVGKDVVLLRIVQSRN